MTSHAGAARRMRIVVAALALAAGAAMVPAAADPSDEDDASVSDVDYAAGKTAMAAQRWADAVQLLKRAEVRFPDNANLQNDLGYSYRSLKQFETAFRHYERALVLDPRHRAAHEYIGEAYLMVDDLPSAERHLAALREICLLPCEERGDLENAISEYRKRKPAS
jgi:Flp pilus assembly protein TadD